MSILNEIDFPNGHQDIFDDEINGQYDDVIWSRDGKQSRNSFSKHRQTNPPSGYICKLCGVPGHWIQQCPDQHNYPKISYWKIKSPPEGYVCRLCGIRGHWIQKCPTAPQLPGHQMLMDEEWSESLKVMYDAKHYLQTQSQNESLHSNADLWMNPFPFEKGDHFPASLSTDPEPSRKEGPKQDFATNPFQFGALFDPSYLDSEDSNILYMKNIESYDERALSQMIFSLTRENVQVHFLKDSNFNLIGQTKVICNNSSSCLRVLRTLNGQTIPNSDQKFEITRGDTSWGNRHSTGQKIDLQWSSDIEKQKEREKETSFSIFVGNLPLNVDRTTLFHTFHERYPSVTCARVMHDNASGISKGYGFVIFGDEKEQQSAMIEMQGQYCGERPMRLNIAKRKTL